VIRGPAVASKPTIMMTGCRVVVAAALLLSTTCATDISGVVLDGRRPALPAPNALLVLNGGQQSTSSRADGSFTFYNASVGVHHIEIRGAAHGLLYPIFKVQVSAESPVLDADGPAAGSLRVVEYRHPGAAKIASVYPIEARPVAAAVYFDERPQASVFSFLLNPQLLLMVAVGGLALCLPKMQQNMDPETRREFEQSQAAMQDPMSMFRQMLGGGGDASAVTADGGRGEQQSDAAARRPARREREQQRQRGQ